MFELRRAALYCIALLSAMSFSFRGALANVTLENYVAALADGEPPLGGTQSSAAAQAALRLCRAALRQTYRLRTAAGSRLAGELRAEAEGEVEPPLINSYAAQEGIKRKGNILGI